MSTPAERYAAAKLRGQHPITTEFIQTFEFEFDPFQVTACHAVEDGKGVLVAAPTGAGKTVVGEFADTLVFCTIAFYGIITGWDFVNYVLFGYLYKTLLEVFLLPVTYNVIKFVKKKEASYSLEA